MNSKIDLFFGKWKIYEKLAQESKKKGISAKVVCWGGGKVKFTTGRSKQDQHKKYT